MTKFQPHQPVFAKKEKSEYYYPAKTWEIFDDTANVAFLDGKTEKLSKQHILHQDEAFKILQFEGKWKNRRFFYKGVLNSEEMRMDYNDGDVEYVELSQLRGRMPNEKYSKSKSGATDSADAADAIITIISSII